MNAWLGTALAIFIGLGVVGGFIYWVEWVIQLIRSAIDSFGQARFKADIAAARERQRHGR